MVSVDEPQLDSVGGAGALDCGEEVSPFTVRREVSEVADLDDHRAAVVGGGFGEAFDPSDVAMGVAGDEDATNVVSADVAVHDISVTARPHSASFAFDAPVSDSLSAAGVHDVEVFLIVWLPAQCGRSTWPVRRLA